MTEVTVRTKFLVYSKYATSFVWILTYPVVVSKVTALVSKAPPSSVRENSSAQPVRDELKSRFNTSAVSVT